MESINNNLTRYFEQFIIFCKVKNLSKETLKYYREQWDYFKKFHSDDNPASINQQLIEDYIIYLRELPFLSDMSVNTRLRGLRAILNYFIEKEYINKVSVKLIKAEKKIKETFTDDQLRRILKKPNPKKCRFARFRGWAIANYLLATGNRAGTVINLKIKDIDFEQFYIKVKNKKGRNEQIIPLSYRLAHVLYEYLEYRDYTSEDDYLFVTEDGRKMTVDTLGEHMRRFHRKLGFEGCLHKYRHTFAKLWILNGGDEFRLQKMLGHKRMQMTAEYVQMFRNDLKRDFEQFNPLDRMNIGVKIRMKRDYSDVEEKRQYLRDYRKRKKQGNKGE
jgi:integrase/recombinase XerD